MKPPAYKNPSISAIPTTWKIQANPYLSPLTPIHHSPSHERTEKKNTTPRIKQWANPLKPGTQEDKISEYSDAIVSDLVIKSSTNTPEPAVLIPWQKINLHARVVRARRDEEDKEKKKAQV